MKRDSIYYQIFKRFPGLLFELVEDPPLQAQKYQFESIEVKETTLLETEEKMYNFLSKMPAISVK